MKSLVGNILLAITWAAMTEGFTVRNLALGFVLGYLILWFIQPVTGPSKYTGKVVAVIRFLIFLIKEIIVANLRVAGHVLGPISRLKPGLIAMPLEEDQNDLELTLVANMITLTPGSFAVDVSPDRTMLYVHVMDAANPDEIRQETKDSFERAVLEVLR